LGKFWCGAVLACEAKFSRGRQGLGWKIKGDVHVGSKVAAKRIRSIQVQTASNGVIFKIGR
jgi:hypothetical protein